MLYLCRRHTDSCPHKSLTWKRCKCPIHVYGILDGRRVRQSLDTRNWEVAEQKLRELESGNEVVGVSEALDRFVADCMARKLQPGTLGKYRLLSREMKDYFGSRSVHSIGLDDISEYRETWKLSAISSRKKIERLRTFFRFCVDRGWAKRNAAMGLKAPVGRPAPTLPFTDDEMERIIWATDVYPNKGIYSFENGKRVKAFVNLLRFSGLRIRDAVMLSRDKLDGNKLLLYTQKTGQPVWLPLRQSVVDELHEVAPTGTYFFWSGNGLPKSAVADWQRSLARLFRLASVKGHAHRFRDTFSVSLLRKGVSLETVSILLGHSSVKITEKHYAPWVQSRQEALEEAVVSTWK